MSKPFVMEEWAVRAKGSDFANRWPLDKPRAVRLLLDKRGDHPEQEWELVSRTVTTTEWETHNA